MASGLLIAGMGGANAFADSVASGGGSSDHSGGASHDVTKPSGSSTAGGGHTTPGQAAGRTDDGDKAPSKGRSGSGAKKDKRGSSGSVAQGGSDTDVHGPRKATESGTNATGSDPSSKQNSDASPGQSGETGTSTAAAGEHQPSATSATQQTDPGSSAPAPATDPTPATAIGIPGIRLPKIPSLPGLPTLAGLPGLPGLPKLPTPTGVKSGAGSAGPASPTSSPTTPTVKPTTTAATSTINLMGLMFSLPAAAVHTTPTGTVQSVDLTKIPLASLVPRLPRWDQLPQLPDVSNIPVLAQLAVIPVFVLAHIAPVYDFVAGLANATLDVATSLPFMQTSISMLGEQVVPVMNLGRPNRTPAPTAGVPVAPVLDTPAFPALKFDNPVVVSAPAEVPAVRSPEPTTFGAKHEIVADPAFRAGYPDYLRAAGLSEVAAVAVPGFTGILILTGAGGLVGYRQARAGHVVRRSGTARFMT